MTDKTNANPVLNTVAKIIQPHEALSCLIAARVGQQGA